MDDLTPPDTAEMRRLADEGYEPADLRRSLRRAADWIDAALAAAGEPQPATDEWRCCNVATCPECNPLAAAGAAPSTPQPDDAGCSSCGGSGVVHLEGMDGWCPDCHGGLRAERVGGALDCKFATGRCVYDECWAAGRCLAAPRRPAGEPTPDPGAES